MSSVSGWYAVQTHINAENKAALHLERQGYQVYLPRLLKRRRHARRVDTVAAPLFPRYLFVGVDLLAQRWRSIQSTIGVTRLVCSGDKPALVPSVVIEALHQSEDERGFVRLHQPPRFAQGDSVRIVDGVFTDCLGLYEGMADRERIAVLLDLLGRKARVVLDAESVVAA